MITSLLRETTEVFAPAQLLEAKLESGLAEENAALQGYALLRDTTLLGTYRSTRAENDQLLAALEHLAAEIDTQFVAHLAAARQHVDEWRDVNRALLEPPGARADIAAAVRLAQARYDVTFEAMDELSSDLAADVALRDRRVRELEHFSLASNVALVLAALAALYAVATLTLRERRLAASLRERVEDASASARQEAALRTAAERLAAASTVDEVMQRIADAALEAVPGHGAFVEQIDRCPNQQCDTLAVSAVAGTGVPSLGSSCPFRGSYAEQVLASGKPASILELGDGPHVGMLSTFDASAGPALAVPLISRGTFVGAFFVLGVQGLLPADDIARAAILGHLAALAHERIQLLDEAIEGRRNLERVIASRSRLMRGFSHDVKNPIGAADGYAALLADGIYGTLNPQQQESIARMRRSIHDALSLIDDLHELARAETGHLALRSEPVELTELVRDIIEEYDAGAKAKGLALATTVAGDVPIIHTTRSRVRQIASNLLSNAIKYTTQGSVTIRVACSALGPTGERGDWVTIEFSDTGRGIGPDKLDIIFEEFRRIGDSDQAGAGLGLAISRSLAQALGGQITVTSELGRGSTFTLWLPVRSPDRGDESAEERSHLRVEDDRRDRGGERESQQASSAASGRGNDRYVP
ncbi:MAG: sensor histidine kinase [Gemmatimonadaceae bacterium]